VSVTATSIEATLFNIQRFSTEDGPGIRTTVFFKACPMRCPWCHNPESIRPEPEVVWHAGRCLGDRGCVDVCPEGALRAEPSGIAIDRSRCRGCGTCVDFCPSAALEIHGHRMGVDDLVETLLKDAAFYAKSGGGVTLSGGEPLLQPKAATAVLRALRERGVHTALDTCGVATENTLKAALQWTDLVLIDIKTVDPERHRAFTGVAFDRVRDAARTMDESGVEVWVRTPIIPGYTADEESVRRVARFVAETFRHCTRHDLLAFSNLCTAKYAQLDRPFALADTPLLDANDMERLCRVARDAGSPHARWSGPTRVADPES